MSSYDVTFQSPAYLLLALLIPLLWWASARSLSALGPMRRWLALALRTVVLLALILALAEIQVVRTSNKLTVVYLVDQSLSIPSNQRQAAVEYVNGAIREHRHGEDRAGVIVFGRDASIEIPPFADDVQIVGRIESPLDPEYTNLAAAMKLAQAAFPDDSARRIVVVSDGNENLGNALAEARAAAGAGIGIDVVPVHYQRRAEVSVQRVVLPSDVRRGQPFDLKAVLANSTRPTAEDSGEVTGRLVISCLRDGQPEVLSDQRVVIPPGKKVFAVRQKIDTADFYRYEARFLPERAEDDGMPQNNRATASTHIRGRGRILLIEDYEHPGEHQRLAAALKSQNLELTLQTSDQLFAGLAELQPFDAVILANVPRDHFADAHIKMLSLNTRQSGAGLVMIGGPRSFGAGGWAGTEIEKAMPIDFQIRNPKVVPSGAMVLVLDASGSMAGDKLRMSKASAIATAKTLGRRDYLGVVAFDSAAQWILPLQRVESLPSISNRIGRLAGGGGTNMRPGMDQAFRALRGAKAAVKHIIILTDGQTAGGNYPELARQIRRENITISTVAVGPDADAKLLNRVAAAAGGKFYRVVNPKMLPRIFIKEARRITRPLVRESAKGMVPERKCEHEMLRGIKGPLPPIHGYVMSSKKESQLVETVLVAPLPPGEVNSTLLAGWSYGLGKTVAFTSDAATRWDQPWTDWAGYDKFFGQIVRWSMRPVVGNPNFTIATEYEEGRVRVVVNALDKSDVFLNFLEITAHVGGPDLEHPPELKIEQTAPGRYEGSFATEGSGSYFITVSPGVGGALLSTAINVPYSGEFHDRNTNNALLGQLANLAPAGAAPDTTGLVIEAPDAARRALPPLEANSFRHDLPKAASSQDAWFALVLVGSCLFFFDVFVRRVQVSLAWAPAMAVRVQNFVLRQQPQPAPSEYIERLRGRKSEVAEQLAEVRQTTRFEAPAETPADTSPLEGASAGSAPPPQPSATAPSISPDREPQQEGSYTARLLKAKNEAWENRRKDSGSG